MLIAPGLLYSGKPSGSVQMASFVTVEWTDPGQSQGKVDKISRKFILNEGKLSNNQEVRVQLSKKRESKARVWNAKVISETLDDRPREPAKRKRKLQRILRQQRRRRRLTPGLRLTSVSLWISLRMMISRLPSLKHLHQSWLCRQDMVLLKNQSRLTVKKKF